MFPLLFVLFIGLPILELYVIVQVGQALGIVPTLGLLVAASIIGAALAKSQSRTAWERFNRALAEGRIPARETFDGAMIILGGALMVTPGFVTDVFAIGLLLPPTRAAVRRFLVASVVRRGGVAVRLARFGAGRMGGRGARPGAGGPAGKPGGYDYEGTAREVDDAPAELPPRGRDG